MAELGSALAGTIRSEFDAVFAVADEPALSELTDQRTASPGLGAPYRQVPVTDLSGSRDPFSVDPALVERGLRGHTDTQNELASVLSNAGIEPRRGLPPGPNFDLAWQKTGPSSWRKSKASPPRTRNISSGSISARYSATGNACRHSGMTAS